MCELPVPIKHQDWGYMIFGADSMLLSAKYFQGSKPTVVVWDPFLSEKPLLTLPNTHQYASSRAGRRFAAVAGRHVDVYQFSETGNADLVASVTPQFASEGTIGRVLLSDTGQQIAVSQNGEGVVEFWDLADTEPEFQRSVETEEPVYVMGWNSTRNSFVIGSQQGGLYYWLGDLDTEPTYVALHQNSITRTYLHPQRKLLVTQAWDSTIRVTDLLHGQEVLLLDAQNKGSLLSNGFTEHGNLGNWSDSNTFGSWRVGSSLIDVYNNVDGTGWACDFHPVQSRLVVKTVGRRIEFWDTKKKQVIHGVDEVHVRELNFSRDGTHFFLSGDAGLQRWDVEVRESGEDIEVQLDGPTSLVYSKADRFTLSPDGKLVVVDIGNSPIAVDAISGEVVTRFGRHHGLSQMQISADGKWLLTGTWQGHGLKIWDMQTGELSRVALEGGRSIVPAANPKNSDEFISATYLKALRNGQIQGTRESEEIDHPLLTSIGICKFDPKGQLLAVVSGSYDVVLLDAHTLNPVAKIQTVGPSRIMDFEFSADGNLLGVACFDSFQLLDLSQMRASLRKLDLDW